MNAKLHDAIQEAAGLAYEHDADHIVGRCAQSTGYWIVAHTDDLGRQADMLPDPRLTVTEDGPLQRHYAAGELTEDWELPARKNPYAGNLVEIFFSHEFAANSREELGATLAEFIDITIVHLSYCQSENGDYLGIDGDDIAAYAPDAWAKLASQENCPD